MKNVLKPLGKSILILVGLTEAGLVKHAAILKKSYWIRYDYTNNLKLKNA